MRIDYVLGCEWEGLYIDGALKTEGHSLSVYDVLNDLGLAFKKHQLNSRDEDNLMEDGYLPKSIESLTTVNKK